MKSIITNKATEQEAPLEYPVLMEATYDPAKVFIVLFTSENVGTVVAVNSNSPHCLGNTCKIWTSATSKSDWKKFEGSITLSN